jgi:hypothetical protein
MSQQPLAGQGVIIIEASQSHSHSQHAGGLLWTSDQAWQYTTLTRDKTYMPPAPFEPTIRASERPHTHASDRANAGIGFEVITVYKYMKNVTILRGITKMLYQSHIKTNFYFILIFVEIPTFTWCKNGKIYDVLPFSIIHFLCNMIAKDARISDIVGNFVLYNTDVLLV